MFTPSQAIQEFVQAANCRSRSGASAANISAESGRGGADQERGRRVKVTAAVAVKFLLARKFDVPRALVLYDQYEESRRDGLYDFDPRSESLKRELETGKFTILVSCARPPVHNAVP